VPAPRAPAPTTGGEYAKVDDLRIYYERSGSGVPIVLLHGGFGTSELWSGVRERLGGRYLVIAPDARGRGRTNDGDGPMSGGRTARDVIGLMDRLGIQRAHFICHSIATLTAVHLLVDYPERVLSATLVGSPLMALSQPNAALRALREDLEAMREGRPARDEALNAFAARWRREAPDPTRFAVAVGKLARATEEVYPGAVLASIRRPVLVVKAGRDGLVEPADFDRLAAAIPGAKTVDFPGATHALPRQDPIGLANAVEGFIASLP
jgi:pimeloyl-ACP methyl ester carboxylesterase